MQQFVNETDPELTVSKTRFIGIDYPALDVFPSIGYIPQDGDLANQALIAAQNAMIGGEAWGNHLVEYNESYRSGAQKVIDFIQEDEQRGCNTQYMLVGYSQGVISARLAINLTGNNADKITSSYVIGDPFQKALAAKAPRQITAANTASQEHGVAREALNTLIMSYLNTGRSIDSSSYKSLVKYRDEMISSDPIIYRDEGENSNISRTLCHEKDPVCGFSVLNIDMEEHNNYFDINKDAGAIDLSLEIEEFDKQVQKLANSTQANPRERVLTKSPSLTGEKTSYNVANTRPDDKCSWDEGSDGIEELVNVPCKIHTVIHSSETAKMAVKVTDSFGTVHPYGSEVEALDPEIIDIVSSLDPDTWYQFKAYQTDDGDPWNYDQKYCLSWNQSAYDLIGTYDFDSSLRNQSCYWNDISDAVDSLKVFKAEPIQTPQGARTRIVSGYDDDYAWTKTEDYFDEISIKPTSNSSNQDFTAKLTSIINDQSYYSFQIGTQCATFVDEYTSRLEECDFSKTNQLFLAIPVNNDFADTSVVLGGLSVEKDIKAPTELTGLRVEIDSEKVDLRWDYSDDERNTGLDYLVYKKDNTTGELVYVDTMWHYTIFPIDLSLATENEMHTYEVLAIDAAGNRSIADTITFETPAKIPKPSTPILKSIANPAKSLTIEFPSYPHADVIAVKLYDGSEHIATIQNHQFTQNNIPSGSGDKLYKYQLVLADNVTTVMSDTLRVNVRYY